jgi:hypothetical protein
MRMTIVPMTIVPKTIVRMTIVRMAIVPMAMLLSLAAAGAARAEALLTSGIGLASCAKLGPDLKPGAGLDHLPNALLFYWTQGYLSAANFMLLNKYTDYVDVGAVTEPMITQMVFDFCKANPDKKPISAIDQFIRETTKVAASKSDAIDMWQHQSAAVSTPPAAKPAAKPAAATNAGSAKLTADDIKWINQCAADNKDGKATPDIVLKYCTCMNDKMDDNETQSITQWEKTHVAERTACDREAGRK